MFEKLGKYDDKIEEMCNPTESKYTSASIFRNKFIEFCEDIDKATDSISVYSSKKDFAKFFEKVEKKYDCAGVCNSRGSFLFYSGGGSPSGSCKDDIIKLINSEK